ncbi:DNA cytosine methyltransferase, partial [Candidatus Kaiserbacteria bacterium]|nr:DNA cytosine methyltransferase [Candidatus Kaiserbacteria bacterium]
MRAPAQSLVVASPVGNPEPAFTVASLFAGIGGFCRAFQNAGFWVTWSNENDPFAVSTYRHNYPSVELFDKSIEQLSVIKDHLTPPDVLTAGFSCQSFSVAGSKKGFDDPRGRLFFEIIRLIREFRRRPPLGAPLGAGVQRVVGLRGAGAGVWVGSGVGLAVRFHRE